MGGLEVHERLVRLVQVVVVDQAQLIVGDRIIGVEGHRVSEVSFGGATVSPLHGLHTLIDKGHSVFVGPTATRDQ